LEVDLKQKNPQTILQVLSTPHCAIFETSTQTFKQLFRNFLKNQILKQLGFSVRFFRD
jgi:hypothetical protein